MLCSISTTAKLNDWSLLYVILRERYGGKPGEYPWFPAFPYLRMFKLSRLSHEYAITEYRVPRGCVEKSQLCSCEGLEMGEWSPESAL